MPELEKRKIQEHWELYINGIFQCSCDVGELKESIIEAYQLFYIRTNNYSNKF